MVEKYGSNLNLRMLVASALLSALLFTSAGIYFLPRIISMVAQRKLTSVTQITNEGKAPLNQISHTHRLATADDHVIVRPNNDTFYSSAWLDLSKGPLVVHVPTMGDRYYSLQFMDAWTNAFAYIGTRATGSAEGVFLVVGPNWRGKVPNGMKIIYAPTNTVWIIGRTMVYGKDDITNVVKLQEKITLIPLISAKS